MLDLITPLSTQPCAYLSGELLISTVPIVIRRSTRPLEWDGIEATGREREMSYIPRQKDSVWIDFDSAKGYEIKKEDH